MSLETNIKIDRNKVVADYTKQLEKMERRHAGIIYSFLYGQYQIGFIEFAKTRDTNAFFNLFKESDFLNILLSLYENVGMHFYKWYRNNFDSFVSKAAPVEEEFILTEKFREFARSNAGAKIRSMSGHKKKEMIRLLKAIYSMPQFQFMNERQLQRVLRARFNELARHQATRIARTEANAAANYGSMETANSMFGQNGYIKEWLSAQDGRERPAHGAANGQKVQANQNFIVGGESLPFPSHPSGSAANIVNCRCQALHYPNESAEYFGATDVVPQLTSQIQSTVAVAAFNESSS